MSADPFGTEALRSSTLDAWVASPTRLAEDAAAEADLVTVGYRDRLLTELAANAADAAAEASFAGELAVWVDGDPGAATLHVANTGSPLTAAGVRSLAALRVSAKSPEDGRIGRFGVGFTATATVADRIEVRSAGGSIVFDRAATVDALTAAGLDGAGPDAGRPDAVPVLRLVWPTQTPPAADFDTEVVLHLREDPAPLLEAMLAQAGDLLLELPALHRIAVGEVCFTTERAAAPIPADGAVGAAEPTPSATIVTVTETRDGNASSTRWLEVTRGGTRWLVDADGAEPPAHDVLRAPTPTDIELSLPCRCITDLPLTPDRRHLHPRAEIADAAAGYVDLVRSVPGPRRLRLVPELHLARNRDDARLVEAVREQLRDADWLPTAGGGVIRPARAVVLLGLTDRLSELLGELFDDLVHPDISLAQHLPTMGRLGVDELGLAGLAERLQGLQREPAWWHDLYDALSPLVSTGREVEELGALPIPRADGRMAVGARGLFRSEQITTPLRWIPTVHPDARHSLLERLGVQELSATDALTDPALRQLVEDIDLDSDSGDDAGPGDAPGLATEVCAVLRAEPSAPVPDWLSQLPLRDTDGELRPADELLMPSSPLLDVLVEDHPFGIVDDAVVDVCGAEALRRLGVGWGFVVLVDELPVAPDHDLPDEEAWWDTLPEPPATLAAVRDLDLVDDQHWPEALSLMATDTSVAVQLADRSGYTAWWLRRHAEVDGLLLGEYRAPSDDALAGILDSLDHPHADALSGALARLEPDTADDASLLLTRLGDPDRDISSGAAMMVHAAVVAACRRGNIDSDEVEVPDRVRTLAGSVTANAVVLDRPWWLHALPDTDVVVAGVGTDPSDAELLATLLDLPLATEECSAMVSSVGESVTWAHPEVVRFATLRGADVPRGPIQIHDELWITLRDSRSEREVRVPWWVDDAGVTHLERRRDPAPN